MGGWKVWLRTESDDMIYDTTREQRKERKVTFFATRQTELKLCNRRLD
jgi:hypothetical protein